VFVREIAITYNSKLVSRTEEAAKYLEQTKLQNSTGYTEEFAVMEDLMG
jgi:hypothetical protein